MYVKATDPFLALCSVSQGCARRRLPLRAADCLPPHGAVPARPVGTRSPHFTRLACMTSRPPMTEIMSPDWAQALTGVEERIHAMGDFLREELAAGREYLPAGGSVFRAFSEPLAGVK